MDDQETLGVALLLAATAAPFVAAGVPKQEAFEKAKDLLEAAVAFIVEQENKPEETEKEG